MRNGCVIDAAAYRDYDLGVSIDVQQWLRSLAAELAPQRELIAALLREAARDERIRVLVVGCSIGRGAADALSDVDALYGVLGESWSESCRDSAALVRRLGDVVDMHQQVFAPADRDGGAPYQHTFAQYASGAQLDLVVAPLRDRYAPRPDWVVLYDPEGRVVGEPVATAATEDQVRQWMHVALVHLSGCAKYLARGSLWEAKTSLDSARAELWRLWAAAERVPDPQYGLTAVLDAPDAAMPANVEATVGALDRRALRSAAVACGELLVWIWPRAISSVTASNVALPPLADWVRRQLDTLPT
jgi:hypothetical protein